MVSVIAFYSNDSSSNTAEDYSFSVKFVLERTKINKKRPGFTHLKSIIDTDTLLMPIVVSQNMIS